MARRSHTRAAAVAGTLLIALTVGATAVASPPDSTPPAYGVVIQAIPAAVEPTSPPPLVPGAARPTPFVAAQHMAEYEGARSLQWQVFPGALGVDPVPLDATANLFAIADGTLVFTANTSPLGSVTAAPDEVIALPIGSSWSLRAPSGAATFTLFGLGFQEGGTAPAGQPFTLGVDGWYELQVRAHQLLPGELTDVGNDSMSTLLIGRRGVVTVNGGQLGAGGTLSTARTTVSNDGTEPATFLEVTATLAPAGGPGTAPVPVTPPPTDAPANTSAPANTPAPTAAPTTTEGPRAPTANNDSKTLYDGRALIDANGSATITFNVMSNDDRGNPQAQVVSVDGSASNVGQQLNNGGPGNTRINADGTATFSTSFFNPAYSVSHSVQYVIQNEHGSSMAVASFEIVFCPEGNGGSC